MLAIAPASLAADDPAAQEAVPAAILPAGQEAPRQTSINTRPVDDSHTDYRYCLELKTNIEIAQCRYKKK